MIIDLYSNIFNESLLLPYWIRHYEPIVDRIFVWDDDSTDDTHEILARCPKVTFLPMGQHGDDDGYWTEVLFPTYKDISRGVSDWVMIADADEIIYHPRLREVLAHEKEIGTQLIKCEGFTMVSEAPPTTTGQIYDEIKTGVPDFMECKSTIHSPEVHVRYGRGRHRHPLVNRTCVKSASTGIRMLHYRYLGEAYYEARDKRILERNRMVYHFDKLYSRDEKRTCPDGTHRAPLAWFAQHKHEAVNVVDDLK